MANVNEQPEAYRGLVTVVGFYYDTRQVWCDTYEGVTIDEAFKLATEDDDAATRVLVGAFEGDHILHGPEKVTEV